ncbi:AAA family ATPase [Nitrobacter sp. TKz-YC01]|uniref:AAA family ATPase n=1 Tax=Nitrobacter sp. TKz-YC01 TaxID=3398703 RepID=UPI003A0FB868
MIYGAPGTGKTRLAYWIARKLDMPILLVKLDGLVSSFLGTTARNIGNLFTFANRYRCVLLLDEFDAIEKVRDDPQEVGEIKRVVNALLQNLDVRQNIGFTIGITNHSKLLDPAVWRRFEIQLEIPKPDFEVRKAIAEYFCHQ